MKVRSKDLLPFVILFIVFNNFFLFGKTWLAKYGLDHLILIIANSLFFVTSVLAYWMQRKALKNSNPNVYVRSVMAGMMIKMMICIITIVVYIMLNKESVSKPSIFAAMGLYLIYLLIEVKKTTRLNKNS